MLFGLTAITVAQTGAILDEKTFPAARFVDHSVNLGNLLLT
jgi:hypothetical protein